MPPPSSLPQLYEMLKRSAKSDIKSTAVGTLLAEMSEASIDFINAKAAMRMLVSKVPGKRYEMACLRNEVKSSRPINADLFDRSVRRDDIENLMAGKTEGLNDTILQKLLYTSAMSVCVALDLMSKGNQKSPGTFFEILVAHLAATKLDANPSKTIAIPSLDIENTLPTDFIFNLGPGKSRIHMPVKISTRERVVQAWAHQRVLEGMHGAGRFRGVLVVLTETNKQKDISVVEVCLPGQWAAYQMYIAALYRVYYFDIPTKYEALREHYPYVPVWPFSRFFLEYERIIDPHP